MTIVPRRKLLTAQEAADDVHVSRRTIWSWIQHSKVEWCVLPSGQRRVYEDSLRRQKPRP